MLQNKQNKSAVEKPKIPRKYIPKTRLNRGYPDDKLMTADTIIMNWSEINTSGQSP